MRYLYHIVEAEVLVGKVIRRLSLRNDRVGQAQPSRTRFVENTHFEAPHVLELLVESDWLSDNSLLLIILLEEYDGLVVPVSSMIL